MTKHRIGAFKLSDSETRDWRNLLPLMSQIVVVHADYKFDTRQIVYLGYSDLFDEIPEFTAAPWYDFEFERTLSGPILVRAIRMDKEP